MVSTDTSANDPSTVSLDHAHMLPFWNKVEAILGGADAMRAAKTTYLPKHEAEDDDDYKVRVSFSPFTNIFGDIAGNLADKPFQKDVQVDDLPDDLGFLIENIDGQNNHLQVFAQNIFYKALSCGLHGVFVDFSRTGQALRTVREERQAGVRPFWVSLDAKDIISVETAKIGGVDQYTHLRFHANTVKRDGYKQEVVERIYEYNRDPMVDGDDRPTGQYGNPRFQLWERSKGTNKASAWVEADSGELTIDVIPLVMLMVGRERNGFTCKPLLSDAADIQVELFQRESSLRYAEENTAFPMLAGNGVTPPTDTEGKPITAPVGPKRVLYAPPSHEGNHGEWKFIEPTAASLKYLADQVQEKSRELREIGRQPLTANSGNLTTVTTSYAAEKGNSAVQSAAFLLKDALENAFALTMQWLGRSEEPQVELFTDFDVTIHGNETVDTIMTLRGNDDLSLETTFLELRRRGVLSPNFDPDDEINKIFEEIPGDEEGSDELTDDQDVAA